MSLETILKRHIGRLRFIQDRKTRFISQRSDIQPVIDMSKVRHATTGTITGPRARLDPPEEYDIIEVLAAIVVARTGIGVGNRQLTMRVRPGLVTEPAATALAYMWDSDFGGVGDQVVLSANQYGFIYYDLSGGFGSINDNGAMTVPVMTPTRFFLARGFSPNNPGSIEAYVNTALGDEQCSCSILYRPVGDTFTELE